MRALCADDVCAPSVPTCGAAISDLRTSSGRPRRGSAVSTRSWTTLLQYLARWPPCHLLAALYQANARSFNISFIVDTVAARVHVAAVAAGPVRRHQPLLRHRHQLLIQWRGLQQAPWRPLCVGVPVVGVRGRRVVLRLQRHDRARGGGGGRSVVDERRERGGGAAASCVPAARLCVA